MKNVIILRGVSGSGKSSFTELIAEPKIICTADDFFMVDGVYKFDQGKLWEAHKACRMKFLQALENPHVENIVVANTNCNPFDFQGYETHAKTAGARITHIIMENRHNHPSVHNVPTDVLERQEQTLLQNLKFS